MAKDSLLPTVRPGPPPHPVQPDEEAVPHAGRGVQEARLTHRVRGFQQNHYLH